MKVIFYVNYPLIWAKGGHTTQILETKKHLENVGVEVKWLHHDSTSEWKADIIHYWSFPPNDFHWQLAKKNGLKIVISTLHQNSVLRPKITWRLRGFFRLVTPYIIGNGLYSQLGLNIYINADAAIAVTPYELEYMQKVLGVSTSKGYYVPNGVDDIFLNNSVEPVKFNGLLCIGYISSRKNSLELARLCKKEKIPIKFIGGATFSNDKYVSDFQNEIDNRYVFWEGEVLDKIRLIAMIKGSNGVVLASQNEGSPLVVLEALALNKSILVSNLKNIKEYLGNNVLYSNINDVNQFTKDLTDLYLGNYNNGNLDYKVKSWQEVASQIMNIYYSIIS